MSTPPQPRFYPIPSPPSDTVFGHHVNLPRPIPTMVNHQLCVRQCSIPENTPSFSDTQHPWQTYQAYYDPGVLAFAHETHTQTPHNPRLWSLSDISEVSSSSSSTAMNKRHNNHVLSAFYSAYDPTQDVAHWESHVAFDPLGTLWPTSSDQQPQTPLVDRETGTPWHHFFNQSNTLPLPACLSHVTDYHHPSLSNDNIVTEPFIPHHPPPHQLSSPTSPDCSPHPTLARSLETGPRSHPSFYRVPRRDSTGLSHRRRPARAIEFDGLWMDEEELLKGLMELDGKLNVHQCRLEEDCAPCHLWIKGDKSSINTHSQKWHGSKPGGDKHEVECRWSACGKTMLKESIGRHIVSIHLGEMWECQGCRKKIARNDAYGRHAVKSTFEACRTSGALITYFADAREINARAALDSGGRLRWAGA